MRLLTKLDEIIIEVLKHIEEFGQDFTYRGMESNMPYINENLKDMSLIEILFEFIQEKKCRDLKREVGAYAVVLTSARLVRGITQEQLVENLGVSIDSLRRWENGQNIPKLESAKKILDYCGVSFSHLLKALSKST